jgi:hypothetical protein
MVGDKKYDNQENKKEFHDSQPFSEQCRLIQVAISLGGSASV